MNTSLCMSEAEDRERQNMSASTNSNHFSLMTVKLVFPFPLKSIRFIASIYVPSLSRSLQWKDYTENIVNWTCIFEVPFQSPDSLTLKAFARSQTHTCTGGRDYRVR